jgi:hypothetical protein
MPGAEIVTGLLDHVEGILTNHADEKMKVEVVANSAVLNLLRSDRSAVAQRVSAMKDKYDNRADRMRQFAELTIQSVCKLSHVDIERIRNEI